MEEATLRVMEAYHRDVGRGIARIDMKVMKKLGLTSGDVIEIKGKSTTNAIVWPGYSEDDNKGVIRIDGNIRGNANVGIDDKVTVRKAVVREANRVIIAPIQQVKVLGGEQYLRRVLEGRPVTKGQKIRVEMLGNPLTFVITATQPIGTVIVSKKTRILMKEKAVEERATPQITYEDIGGLKRELGMVREMIELPLRHPEIFQKLGIDPPKGVLLHGPPGTGKTLIAKAVASETDAYFISISGPEIMSKYYGESEKQLRELFNEGENNAPSIIFIDEIDSIAPKRGEVTGEVERRVVAQLLSLMDGLQSRGQVVVIAATNRPNDLDEALRRGGRFDREIEIGIPDRNARLQILQVHCRGMPLSDDVNLEEIADITHGFVGADLASLCKEAAMYALRSILPEIEIDKEITPEVTDRLTINKECFHEALKNIQPSAMREVFAEVSNVRWKDVGGLEDVKRELVEAAEWPFKYQDAFDAVNTNPPKGILLFGPPGTGKTLLAKAAANESGVNFISIKGAELLSKWVGESEKAVREIFRKARQAAPCIIFLDEIDSIVPVRGFGYDSHVTERVVSQMLTEMDGMEELKDVIIMAATNRPDMLDPALLRPGRFDRLIYIRPPDEREREEIFRIHLAGKPVEDDVEISRWAEITKDYVGADIELICKEAAMLALHELIESLQGEHIKEAAKNVMIRNEHLDKAMQKVKPTLSGDKLKEFEEGAEDLTRYAYV
jgi:transitional endoplasmic reticulum ATPase